MNQDITLFEKVIEKFKFVEPVSSDIQKRIRERKKNQFKKTLKKTGGYSIFFGLISHIFFSLKKMGIGITITKSIVVLVASTVIATSSISTGIYFVVKYIITPKDVHEKEKKREETKSIGGNAVENNIGKTGKQNLKQKPVKKEINDVIDNRIGIQRFQGENVDDSLVQGATDRISNELKKLKGRERVINLRTEKRNGKVGKMLLGSVELLAGSYTITAKIINVKDSKIIYYTSVKINSKDDLDEACKSISKKLSGRLK